MGCGASKAVEIADNNGNAPDMKPKKVEVQQHQHNQEQQIKQPSSPKQSNPHQKAFDDSNDEGLVRNDLMITGRNSGSMKNKDHAEVNDNAHSDDEETDSLSSRFGSAVSTRSAPSIMQRPSSRGGQAFDIQWDNESPVSTHRKPPRRLQKLKGKKRELTLEELKQKQQQAAKRKEEYDARVRAKIQADSESKERKKHAEIEERSKEIEKSLNEKTSKAEEQRQQHFRNLRDKLREKEEHSRKVREKKKELAQDH
eukprot:m.9659 g.9659  ORF g.9659 m.9659 type:complete len:255 (-) comp3510_c0_seq1:156-920(-)